MRHPAPGGAWRTCLLVLGFCLAGSAHATRAGATPQGNRYASGGISAEEQAALHSQRDHYALWVVTAAKKSGAYLSDVRVKVLDAKDQVVFDAPLDGPWLMIDLPLGRYVVEARFNGETQQHTTTIHPQDHHQVFFYFEAEADVVSEPEQAPASSPFGGKLR